VSIRWAYQSEIPGEYELRLISISHAVTYWKAWLAKGTLLCKINRGATSWRGYMFAVQPNWV
jgi:hypothetical protein